MTLQMLLPHISILMCNMYYVFFLIDRINTAMNFIDNGLTRAVLLIAIACCVPTLLRLRRISRKGLSRIALYACAGLSCVGLVLILPACLPGSMIMLNGFVKVLILIMCATITINSVLMATFNHRNLMRKRNRARIASVGRRR